VEDTNFKYGVFNLNLK